MAGYADAMVATAALLTAIGLPGARYCKEGDTESATAADPS